MARTKNSARRSSAAKRAAADDLDDFIVHDDMPVKKAKKATTPKAKKATESTPKKKKAADKLTADDFEPSDVNLNERLTEPLLALAKEEMDIGNKFKGISLRNAAVMLKKYPKEIESGAEALKLKGVGKSIAQKIDDILASGSIHRSNENDANQAKLAIIEELGKVYGINHTLAASLVRDHDVSGVVDLLGKQDLLGQPAKIGLKYFKDFQEPIPRADVETILDRIRTHAGPDVDVREHGQYARGESPIDEIHVLVGADDKAQFTRLLDALHEAGLITDTISSSDAVVKVVCVGSAVAKPVPEAAPAAPKKMFAIPKFSQLQRDAVAAPNLFAQREEKPPTAAAAAVALPSSPAKADDDKPPLHRRLELHYCNKQALAIMFTNLLGPASFFQQLQAAAQAKGYALTAKTLREQPADGQSGAGKHIQIGSEQELFDKLGMEFVPYEERAAFHTESV